MKYKSIIAIIFALVVAVFAGYHFIPSDPTSLGSVDQGSIYQSTTTDATFLSTFKVLNTGVGSLAQVTIATAGTGSLVLYDATTTNSALRTKAATTTLARFAITTTVGTYTFDSVYLTGLLVEVTGANVASTTITFR